MSLTVLCVLKSGGSYDAEWVRKLRDGVARNLTIPYRFVCLSDVDVPCERIPLEHNWEGWWSKIFMFKPGVITGPTIYIDLDTVVCGNLDKIVDLEYDFAMLRNFHQSDYVGSGVMWFKDAASVPHKVYNKFVRQPEAYIAHHKRNVVGSHIGDQAFVFNVLHGDGIEIPAIQDSFKGIFSYKYHARKRLPEGASLIAFHGPPRLPDVKADWIDRHWV